jgi:excinuclease ABC subunit B
MYADRITGSMDRAIKETTRRRKIQEAYNKKHGITPEGIQKLISGTRLSGAKEALPDGETKDIDVNSMKPDELKYYLDELEDQMDLAAKNLEFELATTLRDKIVEVKKLRRLKKK